MARRLALACATLLLAISACGDDGPHTAVPERTGAVTSSEPAPSVSTTGTTAAPGTQSPPAPAVPTTAARATTTTTEPRPPVPDDQLVAVITQNRTDVVENRFQVQLVNGTDRRYEIASVQLAWDGFASADPVIREPATIIVAGQRLDIRTPFPGARCRGDGTRATMPPVADGHVTLELVGGSVLEIPVVDELFIGRRLYEEDCERQLIESLVAVEWVDLREEQYGGRPTTAAELRLTRRAGAGEFTVLEVGNTIPYVVEPVDHRPGEPVVTLAADDDTAEAPVHFLERRCDPHALMEVKQPTNFAAQIRFPDGSVHTYIAYPERDSWLTMRATADAACEQLGLIVPLIDP